MYSRRPTKRNLLHRLSHITDIQEQTGLQGRDIKDARMESMSMQQALSFYVEVCQISNQRKEDAKERTKEDRDRQRRTPGVPVGNIPGMEEEIVLPQTSYDMLDVNRCAGFLLYSYDKHGTHSILGEDNKPGGYGGRITNGEFGRKA